MSAAQNHSIKQKIASSSERDRIQARLLALKEIAWEEKAEQYCDYRLDGTQGDQWVRVKQYHNGTWYAEANDVALLNQLCRQLGFSASATSETARKPEGTRKKSSGQLGLTGPYIGTDESGKGDYFGPLVVAGVYVTEATAQALNDMGVMDSKKLSEKAIEALALRIVQVVGAPAVSCVEIGPQRYNELYAQFKSRGRNLNHLLAWGHATAIENVLAHYPGCQEAVADQFGSEHYILTQLKEKGRQLTLHQTPRAEANTAVAAASIIARNRFVQKLTALSQQIGIPLPKGAGPQVKSQARLIITRYGIDRLKVVAKMHFKITQELTTPASR